MKPFNTHPECMSSICMSSIRSASCLLALFLFGLMLGPGSFSPALAHLQPIINPALNDTNLTRTDTNLTRTDANLTRTDTNLTRTDTNLTRTDTNSALTDTTKQAQINPEASDTNLTPLPFSDILQLYNEGEYEKAILELQRLSSDEASLFLGKSYYAIGHFLPAEQVLTPLLDIRDANLRKESLYTLALVRFGMRDYTRSLELLQDLQNEPSRTAVQVEGERLYRQILRFLTPAERFAVLHQASSNDLKADLIIQGKSHLTKPAFQQLKTAFLSQFQDSSAHTFWKDLIDRNTYRRAENIAAYPTAPEGLVYRIGVLLPEFAPDDPRYTIPRNLYQGLMFAAEQYNASGGTKKVRLHFQPASEHPDTLEAAFLHLVYRDHVDAVIGPLFSGTAGMVSPLAEEHEVPLLLPLANADQINTDHNYTFQLNPVFEVHGKQMARYAVQTLGLDSLAVISQQNSLGSAAANAFRYEAEALGAVIQYLFQEDFRAAGFDLTEFTAPFTTDSVLVDSLGYRPVKGVYAPFTGQEAGTLSRLLANDVELHNKEIVIMGLEEWKNTNLTPWQINQLEIWYSAPFRSMADSSALARLEPLTTELELRFSMEPDLFTYIGVDAGTFLIESLDTGGNPALLKSVLKQKSAYDGAALRIRLDGSKSNQDVFMIPLTDPAAARVEKSPAEAPQVPVD